MAVVLGGSVALYARVRGQYGVFVKDLRTGEITARCDEVREGVAGMAEVLLGGKSALALSYTHGSIVNNNQHSVDSV